MSTRRRWLPLIGAAVLVAVFAGLAWASRTGSAIPEWDGHLTEAFAAWRTPGWSRAFWVFTLLGNDSLIAPLAAALVVLVAARGYRARAAALASGMVLSWVLTHATKTLVGRARPSAALALIEQPGSHSMPSGHALTGAVFFGLLAYVAFRWIDSRRLAERPGPAAAIRREIVPASAVAKLGVALASIALTAGIGLSRVYLGVHWMSDVLAGWCLGGAILLVTLHIALTWERGGGPKVLHDARPWVGRRGRVVLAAGVGLAVVAAAALTVWAEPLL